MTSVAAQAKARAEARLAEAAQKAEEAAAAALKARSRPRLHRPAAADVEVPSPAPHRTPDALSPARQRKAYLIAAAACQVLAVHGVQRRETAGNDNAFEGAAANMLVQLAEDRRRLKQIQSTERKIDLKRQLVPTYRGWCDGVMAGGAGERGPLDEIFTTAMIWTIDIGDYVSALPMAEHVIAHSLGMPPQIERTAATFVVEEIAEAAIAAFDLGGDAAANFPAAVLPQVQDLLEDYDCDIPDPVEAKLHKALGRAIMAGAVADDADDVRARQQQTLACYTRALQLDAKVGVKKDVEKLNRDLGRPTVPGRSDQISPDAPSPSISTVEPASTDEASGSGADQASTTQNTNPSTAEAAG